MASAVYALEVKVDKLRQMDKILAYIEQHFCDELTLAEVAQVAQCHPHSLSRLFSQSLGCSFQSYLGEIRLLKAAQLLLGTGKSITDIAFDVGFRNLSNFNRQFKKKHGLSPSVYRTSLRSS
jgi:AraC-like DNA-binding protein